MILQSITLSGWRCFLEEITVGPFSDRLNVISGSNGIGKSTLFEALRRALMDSYLVRTGYHRHSTLGAGSFTKSEYCVYPWRYSVPAL